MGDYRLSLLAADDLESIYDYTFDKWGAEQVLIYGDYIEAALQELAEDPARQGSKKRDDLLEGCRFYRVQHHYLVYRVNDGCVEVGRVLHEAMNFPDHVFEEVFDA